MSLADIVFLLNGWLPIDDLAALDVVSVSVRRACRTLWQMRFLSCGYPDVYGRVASTGRFRVLKALKELPESRLLLIGVNRARLLLRELLFCPLYAAHERHVILWGPPGCSKTALVNDALARWGKENVHSTYESHAQAYFGKVLQRVVDRAAEQFENCGKRQMILVDELGDTPNGPHCLVRTVQLSRWSSLVQEYIDTVQSLWNDPRFTLIILSNCNSISDIRPEFAKLIQQGYWIVTQAPPKAQYHKFFGEYPPDLIRRCVEMLPEGIFSHADLVALSRSIVMDHVRLGLISESNDHRFDEKIVMAAFARARGSISPPKRPFIPSEIANSFLLYEGK